MSKTKEVLVIDEDSLNLLKNSYPVEERFSRLLLPKLGMVSQDITEGKGKAMKVTTEAGTFFTEIQTDEIGDNGKKVWEKTELGSKIQGIIIYERKKLSLYDKATGAYTNSPVYDTNDEVVRLFSNKQEIAKGTPQELKALYPGVTAKGKPKSNLDEVRVLYVLYKDVLHQLEIRGTSSYSFAEYKRKVSSPNTVITSFSSEYMENGSTTWNKMTFDDVRPLNQEEINTVLEHTATIKSAIQMEKSQYQQEPSEATKEFDKLSVKIDNGDF
jgi:hypothetical protein